MTPEVLSSTNFKDLKLFKRGKVRDVYDLGDKLLIVSTDRISCFDVVLPNCIPSKGKVLTQISLFWFGLIKDIVPNHLITADVNKFSEEFKKYKDILKGRSMLVVKANALPVECIVRGYLSGSGWKEYKDNNSICGLALSKGLKESSKLPQPIFTPSTKADVGHDINIDFNCAKKVIGEKTAEKIKDISIKIYKKASDYAESKGIIIADTKFEFGLYNNEIILIDEVLTPDSSRFWPRDIYKAGTPQQSFDKQFVRDYLETIDWDKKPPAPQLPEDIIQKTSQKYKDIFRKITSKEI